MFVRVKAEPHHCRNLAWHLSAEDRAEIKAVRNGKEPYLPDVLLQGCEQSETAYAIVDTYYNKTLAIGGYGNGCIWMLTSAFVSKFSKEDKHAIYTLLRSSLDEALGKYDVLWNIIHKQSKTHIKFILHLGAELSQYNEDFYLFKFKRKEVSKCVNLPQSLEHPLE